MRTVTHRELRNNSGEVLRSVAAGETVAVTNSGQLAAVIVPPGNGPDRLIAQGGARPARRPLSDLATIRRRPAAHSSAEILADTRGRW